MAFDYTNLYPDTSSNGGYTKSWNYTTVTDSIDTCSASGYFNKVATRLGIGDNIIIARVDAFDTRSRTALVEFADLFVTGISSGVVTTTNYTSGFATTPMSAANINFTQAGTGAVQRTLQSVLGDSVNVKDFGARGDTVVLFDGAISATLKAFTSVSAAFTAADVGKLIRIAGAGAAGVVLETTIATYVSATSVTLTDAASTTVSGATAVYGSDDTTAIQKAVNATFSSTSSTTLHIPRGIYLTTDVITVSGQCTIVGDGATYDWAGSIISPSATKTGFKVTNSYSVEFSSIGVFYPAQANASTFGIQISPTSALAFNYYSKITGVTFNNPYDVIGLDRAVYCVVDGCAAQGFAHVGVTIQNPNGIGDDGVNRIVNSNWIGGSGAVASLYWTAGGAVVWSGNSSLSSQYGVFINPRAGADTSQLIVDGNQIDGMTVAGVLIQRQAATGAIEELVVSNNTFNLAVRCVYAPTDASGIGVSKLVITGNSVRGALSGFPRFFDIDSVNNVYIGGNALASNTAGTLGIAFGSAATNVVLGPNSFSGTFAVDWQNASSSFKVATAITPNLGGIIYSAADRLAILNGTSTAGQMLRSGNVAAPTWSTATWPATTTINQLLYSNSANTIAGLATANSSVLSTNGSGVPSFSNAQAQANLSLRILAVTVSVNFNSANTDTAIPFTLPSGFTRMVPFRALIDGASGSLTTSTFGVFSAPAGGGVAIQAAGTANTVSTASDATLNNTANFAFLQTTSFVAASLATPNTVYFRVGTAQGSAATANVTFYYFVEP